MRFKDKIRDSLCMVVMLIIISICLAILAIQSPSIQDPSIQNLSSTAILVIDGLECIKDLELNVYKPKEHFCSKCSEDVEFTKFCSKCGTKAPEYFYVWTCPNPECTDCWKSKLGGDYCPGCGTRFGWVKVNKL